MWVVRVASVASVASNSFSTRACVVRLLRRPLGCGGGAADGEGEGAAPARDLHPAGRFTHSVLSRCYQSISHISNKSPPPARQARIIPDRKVCLFLARKFSSSPNSLIEYQSCCFFCRPRGGGEGVGSKEAPWDQVFVMCLTPDFIVHRPLSTVTAPPRSTVHIQDMKLSRYEPESDPAALPPAAPDSGAPHVCALHPPPVSRVRCRDLLDKMETRPPFYEKPASNTRAIPDPPPHPLWENYIDGPACPWSFLETFLFGAEEAILFF